MSSHHVIRDNQEAAVAVLDVEQLDYEILGDALEWSPFVMTTALMAEPLVTHGFKLDLIIGSSLDTRDNVKSQSHIKYIEADTNVVKQMIQLAENNKHPAIIIFASFDKCSKDIEAAQIPISVIESDTKWTLINSGYLKKWFSKGDTFKLFSSARVLMNDDIEANEEVQVSKDGLLRLHSKKPFWLGEKLI